LKSGFYLVRLIKNKCNKSNGKNFTSLPLFMILFGIKNLFQVPKVPLYKGFFGLRLLFPLESVSLKTLFIL